MELTTASNSFVTVSATAKSRGARSEPGSVFTRESGLQLQPARSGIETSSRFQRVNRSQNQKYINCQTNPCERLIENQHLSIAFLSENPQMRQAVSSLPDVAVAAVCIREIDGVV